MNDTEQDKWPLWQVVKSLDLAYHEVVPLLENLGIEIQQERNGQQYISKRAFRGFLQAL